MAQPQSYETFAGLVWLAVVVTMGVRSITAAALGGLAFALLPGVFQTYFPAAGGRCRHCCSDWERSAWPVIPKVSCCTSAGNCAGCRHSWLACAAITTVGLRPGGRRPCERAVAGAAEPSVHEPAAIR